MGEVRLFTRAEVAVKNGSEEKAVWIIYRDSVYDVTKYLHEHPAGHDPILEEAGKDASKAFDDTGHSGDAKSILAKHKIGEIVEEEKWYGPDGKKKKKTKRQVVADDSEAPSRSCLSLCTCGLL